MLKAQLASVQRDAGFKVRPTAVLAITKHRESAGGQLDAYLVLRPVRSSISRWIARGS